MVVVNKMAALHDELKGLAFALGVDLFAVAYLASVWDFVLPRGCQPIVGFP